jgi:hypothetical protein
MHRAAAAPVVAVFAGQEVLVDEVAAQRGVVVMESAEHRVNLGLAVAPAGLEGLGDAVEQQQSLTEVRPGSLG